MFGINIMYYYVWNKYYYVCVCNYSMFVFVINFMFVFIINCMFVFSTDQWIDHGLTSRQCVGGFKDHLSSLIQINAA